MWLFRRRDRDDPWIPIDLCGPGQTCDAPSCSEPAVCSVRYSTDVLVYCAADTIRTIWADKEMDLRPRVSRAARKVLDEVHI